MNIEIKSDSLVAVNCLFPYCDNFSKICTLSFDFISRIDTFTVSFSHVHQIDNYPAYLLVKLALTTDQVLEWIRFILNVTHTISLNLNNI